VKCCTLSTWGEIFKVNGIFRGLHVTDFYHGGISKFLSLKVLTSSNVLEQAAQEVVESLLLEVFMKSVDVALMDTVCGCGWVGAAVGLDDLRGLFQP